MLKKCNVVGLCFVACIALAGCKKKSINFQEVVANAKTESQVISLAMPDEWANWGETWTDLFAFYNISHSDTDMNSADELDNFAKGIGDIGDVGYSYGKEAEKKKLTEKYKTSYWAEIPNWAKDDDGDWIVAYTGTLAFMVKDADKSVQLSWADLLSGDYTVGTSDVCTSSQAQYTVYAAALALGGNYKNIKPGIEFFKTLANQGRLTDELSDQTNSLASNVDVNIKWDFVALGYRDAAYKQGKSYGVCIPSDGSVTVGYASIINKKAKNPNAAKLAREYILSDAGQINLASGYATPIRSILYPAELEASRVSRSQYNETMIDAGLEFTDEIAAEIVSEWKEQVLPILNKKGRVK